MTEDPTASPVDKHVGQRIRLRRIMLGMSQETLADAIGVTYQQVQKYEAAKNRVSASRLWDMAAALDCPVSYFFEHTQKAVKSEPSTTPDPMIKPRNIKLVRMFISLKAAQQDRVFNLMRTILGDSDDAVRDAS